MINEKLSARVIQVGMAVNDEIHNPTPGEVRLHTIQTNIDQLRSLAGIDCPNGTPKPLEDKFAFLKIFAKKIVVLYDALNANSRLRTYLSTDTPTFEDLIAKDPLFVDPSIGDLPLSIFALQNYLWTQKDEQQVFFMGAPTHAIGHITGALDAQRVRELEGNPERRKGRIIHVVLDHHPDTADGDWGKASVYAELLRNGHIDDVIFVGVNGSLYEDQVARLRNAGDSIVKRMHAIPLEEASSPAALVSALKRQFAKLLPAQKTDQPSSDVYVAVDFDVDVLDGYHLGFSGYDYNPLMPLMYLGYVSPYELRQCFELFNSDFSGFVDRMYSLLSSTTTVLPDGETVRVDNIAKIGFDLDAVGVDGFGGLDLSAVLQVVDAIIRLATEMTGYNVHMGIDFPQGIHFGDIVEAGGKDINEQVYRAVCAYIEQVLKTLNQYPQRNRR